MNDMYEEMRRQLRAAYLANRSTKLPTRSVQDGGCPDCGHIMYGIDRSYFCPCEDCHDHPGGTVVRTS